MRATRIITAAIVLAFVFATANAQKDTTAIFERADALIYDGDVKTDEGDFNKALKLYLEAANLTKSINKGYNLHYATALYDIGYLYHASEEYKLALDYYTQVMAIYKDILDIKNPDFAELLNNIGMVYSDTKDYPNAIKYFSLVKEIRKEVLGKEHPEYVSTLYNLGVIHYYNNDKQNALDYFIQVYDIRKKLLGADNPKCIELLDNICHIAYTIGDNQNSLKYMLQLADIRKKTLGTDNYDYATTLFNIGDIYGNINDHENSLKYYTKATEIIKKVLGTEHPDYASALNNIGLAYDNLGNLENALKYYTQALEIRRKALGTEHEDYAASLYNVGSSYMFYGNYQKALDYLLQALEIRKRILGTEHPDYASTLNNIGLTYKNMGDYMNAIKYYNMTLDVKKRIYGEDNPNYALTLNNLGATYHTMNDYQTALKYYMQAMEIYKKHEDPSYANSLNNLGMLFNVIKRYQYALEYYQKAMEIWKIVYGEDSPEYANALNNVGVTYSNMGEHQKALKYHTQAMELRKKLYGEKHHEYANCLNNIGNEYSKMGDYQNALKYLLQAKEITKNSLGESHPDYTSILNNIDFVYSYTGDYQNAIITLKQATDQQKNNLIRNFSFMTSHEREAYWYKNYSYFARSIKYMYHEPNNQLAVKTSYDSEILTKGLLLASEISIANIIGESGNSSLIAEYENMKAMNMRLNKELEKPIAERTINCDSLENEVRKHERHVMENCKDFGDITDFLKIDWKDIQKSMKPNDVAIEFTNFTENDTTRYLALVLNKNMEVPVCIPLFEQSEMQKLQRGVAAEKIERQPQEKEENRGATSVSGKRQGIYESTGLYNMVWKPMEKYFPENPRIFFAPSGMLHQIAIEYAPINHDNIISDKYEIYRVSSTRYLTMDYMPKPMSTSVLYGGIYYDCDTITMKKESARFATRSTGVSSFAALNEDEYHEGLAYLPGTKTEVENIVSELKKKKIKTSLLEGTTANEESFKSLSGSNISVLHIATHGFFLHTDKELTGDNTLVQSGLLLSGANIAWKNMTVPQGVEDGILTAKEISYMDLRKTDLVVLSACQTALGEINNEGVFGLQRGFKKAGVKTIIMSLWPVDDNATLLMMTEFYGNMAKGMSKREAFLSAQSKVKTTPGFENPRFWAAFIMLDGNE